jgi:hypothetical protein
VCRGFFFLRPAPRLQFISQLADEVDEVGKFFVVLAELVPKIVVIEQLGEFVLEIGFGGCHGHGLPSFFVLDWNDRGTSAGDFNAAAIKPRFSLLSPIKK